MSFLVSSRSLGHRSPIAQFQRNGIRRRGFRTLVIFNRFHRHIFCLGVAKGSNRRSFRYLVDSLYIAEPLDLDNRRHTVLDQCIIIAHFIVQPRSRVLHGGSIRKIEFYPFRRRSRFRNCSRSHFLLRLISSPHGVRAA